MGFLYGNIISHTPRSRFQFDKIYPNRKSADDECGSDKDKVGMYRYILIDYNINEAGYEVNLALDQNTYGIINYSTNLTKDQESYGKTEFISNYDQTVWQKQYASDGKTPIYRAIDRLHSVLPIFENIPSQPSPLPTFQPLNAFPLILEYVSNQTYPDAQAYEGFGTAVLNSDSPDTVPPELKTSPRILESLPEELNDFNTATIEYPIK